MTEIDSFSTQFMDFIRKYNHLVITTHVNADMDGIASSIGLRSLILSKYPHISIQIISPQVNALVNHILTFLKNSLTIKTDWPTTISCLIVVDTNDLLMTEYPRNDQNILNPQPDNIIIIDHHSLSMTLNDSVRLKYIDNTFCSNSEIIQLLFKSNQIVPDLFTAKVMALGILTDTGNFRYGTNSSVANFNDLLNLGINLEDLTQTLSLPIGRSERIARLKSASRLDGPHSIGEILVAISYVSSYEASASKGLVDLGADIGIVIVIEKNKKFRLSGRVSDNCISTTQFHLGNFLSIIGSQFNGSGGGHDGAAGCYGTTTTENQFEEIKNYLLKKLKEFFIPKNETQH